MPCRDYYDDHPDQYFRDVTEPALKKQISFAESALCQTLAALEVAVGKAVYEVIDYEAAGITKADLVKWHKNHKKLDEQHRKEEAEKKRVANLKSKALAKLSAEERKALGVA